LRTLLAIPAKIAELFMLGLIGLAFGLLRLLGPERASNLGAAVMRTIGLWLPPHRTALTNIRAAFPGMAEDEVKRIARGAWENLGRTGAEYAHLGTLFDFDDANPCAGRTEVEGIEHFIALRDDAKPGLIFSAHMGNWELPAICAAQYGLAATAVYASSTASAAAPWVAWRRRGQGPPSPCARCWSRVAIWAC
jgi:Kdo2-lipid IVA lauroyltransferase/acyltransferase